MKMPFILLVLLLTGGCCYKTEKGDRILPEPTGEDSQTVWDVKEVNQLIALLDSNDYNVRADAKTGLLSIGVTSGLHAETLGLYLFEHSRKEGSFEIRDTLREIIETLSVIPVVRPFSSRDIGQVNAGDRDVFQHTRERTLFCIDNQSDFLDLAGPTCSGEIEPVNYERNFVLFCCAGWKPSTGYSAKVTKIQRDFENECTKVYYRETQPGMSASAFVTYPTDVVLIPRGRFSLVKVIDADTGKELAVFYPYSTFLIRDVLEHLAKSKDMQFALKVLSEFALDETQSVWARKAAISMIGQIKGEHVVDLLIDICRKIKRRGQYKEADPWKRGVLYKAALSAWGRCSGPDSLAALLEEWAVRMDYIPEQFGRNVRDMILKERATEIESIVKNPESVRWDQSLKDKAMLAYIYFHSGEAFPVLIEYAHKTGSIAAYNLIRVSLNMRRSKVIEEGILEKAEQWYKENKPYIVCDVASNRTFARFHVDQRAKAAKVPVEIWRRIHFQKRRNWDNFSKEEKEKLIAKVRKDLEKEAQDP